MKAYRIKAWTRVHEKNDTRKYDSISWISVPNSHDSEGYQRIMRQPDGCTIYGAYLLMAEISSRLPRNLRGWIVSVEGIPLTADTLAVKTGAAEEAFEKAFKVLSDKRIEWIVLEEFCLSNLREPRSVLGDPRSAHPAHNDTVRYGTGVTLHNNTGVASPVPVREIVTPESCARDSSAGPGRTNRNPTSSLPRKAWCDRLVLSLVDAFQLPPERVAGQRRSFARVAWLAVERPDREAFSHQIVQLAEQCRSDQSLDRPIAAWQATVKELLSNAKGDVGDGKR